MTVAQRPLSASAGGYETTRLRDGLIFDESEGMLPSRLLGFEGPGVAELGAPYSTTYGYVVEGGPVLEENGRRWGPLAAGHYFSVPGPLRLSGEGSVAVFERIGVRGLFFVGGPTEKRGRLSYIDGCHDTLLVYPHRFGDPCINILWFPKNVRQTIHLHPTLRLAVVVSGTGRAFTPDGELPLEAGSVFRLEEMSLHCFHTDDSTMAIVTYHPDSDWGPTDDNHPMLNRTLVGK